MSDIAFLERSHVKALSSVVMQEDPGNARGKSSLRSVGKMIRDSSG